MMTLGEERLLNGAMQKAAELSGSSDKYPENEKLAHTIRELVNLVKNKDNEARDMRSRFHSMRNKALRYGIPIR